MTMEPSFEKLLVLLAEAGVRFVVVGGALIGWKERSVREKDRLDAMALRRLEEDPGAFD